MRPSRIGSAFGRNGPSPGFFGGGRVDRWCPDTLSFGYFFAGTGLGRRFALSLEGVGLEGAPADGDGLVEEEEEA